jgi:hypothetical protein
MASASRAFRQRPQFVEIRLALFIVLSRHLFDGSTAVAVHAISHLLPVFRGMVDLFPLYLKVHDHGVCQGAHTLQGQRDDQCKEKAYFFYHEKYLIKIYYD